MKVLVLGGGGREHVMASVLFKSKNVNHVYVSPGNGGTANEFENVALDITPPYSQLINWVVTNDIGFVAVGPEAYLVEGVVDALTAAGIPSFGPTKAAAKLEGSKQFAKEIMSSAGVPTASYAVFKHLENARAHIQSMETPIVLKADGLAAGKGVIIATTKEEAIASLDEYFVSESFGDAGKTLVIESFLRGQEASILAFSDGKTVKLLTPSQDHKRALDGDRGPNTGGMGVYTPVKILNQGLIKRVEETILLPTLQELNRRGVPYKGILYAGLMIDGDDIHVVEFNCRFGDPEAQCVLPLLESDLLETMQACVKGELESSDFKIRQAAICTVVMASGGYPKAYEKGHEITGLERVKAAKVYHAGTKKTEGKVVTAGGRVLAISAEGEDLQAAIQKAYADITKVNFKDAYYRKDIGQKGL